MERDFLHKLKQSINWTTCATCGATMSLYSLYQDPMQSQPLQIPTEGIGMQMLPDKFSLSDPILLRHVLCFMIVVRNLFHAYLCWRQLYVCDSSSGPPRIVAKVMTQENYDKSKAVEMLNVEQHLDGYLIDAVFSCIELFCGILPFMWRLVITCYRTVDDYVWQNIVFMGLLATYMILRGLPLMFYRKFVLEPFYRQNPSNSLPVVGLLCTYALLVLLIQVVLIPFTTVFIFIEQNGGTFFVLWIWGFVFTVTCIFFVLCYIFGIPVLGKATQLPPNEISDGLTVVLDLFQFPKDCVYYLRTPNIITPTVYAWGFWRFKRVYIVENIVYNMGRDEKDLHPDDIGKGLLNFQLDAYIVHELSHWHFHHLIKLFVILQITLLVYLIIYGVCYQIGVLYEAAGFPPHFYPPIVGYWLVYKYVMPVYLTVTNWLIFYIARKFEYKADAYTLMQGYAKPLKSALLKLSSDNLNFPYVDNWYMMWNRCKPTYVQRIVTMTVNERHSTISAIM